MSQKSLSAVALVVLVVWLALNSFYVVDAGQQVVVQRLGSIQSEHTKPGVYFKVPLLESALSVDARMRVTNLPALKVSVAADNDDQSELKASAYVNWRIDALGTYANQVGVNRLAAHQDRDVLPDALVDAMVAALSKQLTNQPLADLMVLPDKALTSLLDKLNAGVAKDYGIQLLSLDVMGLSWPTDERDAIHARMKEDIAADTKQAVARGQAKVKAIDAEYATKAANILADAKRKAEEIRAEGDSKAADIYAASYGKDAEFYRFYRSLEAYRASFNKNDFLVLTPDSDFFHYFKQVGSK